MWGKGFVDIVQTDGDIAIAWYLGGNYFKDSFADQRLAGFKSYICSRNIDRPVDYRDVDLSLFRGPDSVLDLSTAKPLQSREYNTQWLGRANYQQYAL